MILAPFRLHRPATVDGALALASEHAGQVDFLAGGTDMLQNYKNRLHVKDHVIALDAIDELVGIVPGRIGAMERLNDVAANPVVREHYAGLADAIGHIASPLIRNSGTIGGNLLVETRCYYYNQTPFWRDTRGSCMKAESDECLVVPQKEICYAAYSGDLAPILLVLQASVVLASTAGRRTVALRDFYRGDGIEKNVLGPGEMIVSIEIPEESATLRSGYRKLRVRDTMDYPEMGVAASCRLHGKGRIRELRAAATAVDVVPQFVDYTTEHADKPLAEVIDVVAADMEERAKPMKNLSMPVGYRKKMVRVFLRRLLQDLLEENGATAG